MANSNTRLTGTLVSLGGRVAARAPAFRPNLTAVKARAPVRAIRVVRAIRAGRVNGAARSNGADHAHRADQTARLPVPVTPSPAPVPAQRSAPPAQGGRAILSAFDKAAETRWEQALKTAKAVKGDTVDDKVKEVTRMFTNELAVVGAAAGGVSSVAHFGAVTAIGAAAAELGWFSRRLADLVLTMAAVHGHTEASVEERRTWVVSVLAHGRSHAALSPGEGVPIESNFSGQNAAMAVELLRQANRFLSHRLVVKWATKRGNVMIGRAVPFGIGATIGASANFTAVRNVARQADSFFRQLPVYATPATGFRR